MLTSCSLSSDSPNRHCGQEPHWASTDNLLRRKSFDFDLGLEPVPAGPAFSSSHHNESYLNIIYLCPSNPCPSLHRNTTVIYDESIQKSFDGMDPYVTLGVCHTCSDDELKQAYRKLLLQYHPDKAGPDSKAKCQEIIDAYEKVSRVRHGHTQDHSKHAQFFQADAAWHAWFQDSIRAQLDSLSQRIESLERRVQEQSRKLDEIDRKLQEIRQNLELVKVVHYAMRHGNKRRHSGSNR